MSKASQILISILIGLIVVFSFQLYINKQELNAYEKHNEMQQRAIENYRENKIISDSLINILEKIKITKITIIEKDTVR